MALTRNMWASEARVQWASQCKAENKIKRYDPPAPRKASTQQEIRNKIARAALLGTKII